MKKENTVITHFVDLDQTVRSNIKNTAYNFLIAKGYSVQTANAVVENFEKN